MSCRPNEKIMKPTCVKDLELESKNLEVEKFEMYSIPKKNEKRLSDTDVESENAMIPKSKRRKSEDQKTKLPCSNIDYLIPESEFLSDSFLDEIEERHKRKKIQSREEDHSTDENINTSFNASSFFSQFPEDEDYNQLLTQATDCLKDAKNKSNNFVVEDNVETASQYARFIHNPADYSSKSIINRGNNHQSTSRHLPVSSISYRNIGPFFGLTNVHKQYIFKTKNITDLYDWQNECLNLRAIYERKNLIYALPTSGGKTLVAEIAMFREILLRSRNVIFVLPYVSIVQEKFQDLTPFAVEFNFLVEEYCAGKGCIPPIQRRKKNVIYICTIEKSAILFDSLYENNRLKEIGLIVVDELHLVGDSKRGFILESLLTKAVNYDELGIQVIGMSATISNLPEVATFLKADVYTRDFRPVELTESVKIGNEIFSINSQATSMFEAFQKLRDVEQQQDKTHQKRDPDNLVALVTEVCPSNSCLIFCATKDNCENVAKLLSELLPTEFKTFKRAEKQSLIEAIKTDMNGQICTTLQKTCPYGIAYHHSGLTVEERRHIEEAYRLGIICIICCTSTLAAGVNLPAKRVIIRSPYVGRDFLSLTKYKQMVGRAGRAGKCDSGESIVICDKKDHGKLTSLLCSKMDETVSGYFNDPNGKLLKTSILNVVGLRAAKTIFEIVQHFSNSLYEIQLKKTYENIQDIIFSLIKSLIEENAISFKSISSSRSRPAIVISSGSTVYLDDELEVSKMGKASVCAGMKLDDVKIIDSELKIASQCFVLAQHLHLLFIVVPDDSVETLRLDYSLYNQIFLKLDRSLLQTAKVIGINELLVMKMISRPNSIKEFELRNLKRFYVALILYELWNNKEIYDVSSRYKVNRGMVHGLMSSAASKAYSIFKLCEVIEEFWAFRDLLEKFSKRLSFCCSSELLPLMELPSIKIGRAKIMYNAGIRKIEDLAELTPSELIARVRNINTFQANQIIKSAKHALLEKYDTIHEMAEELKNTIKNIKKKGIDRKTISKL